VATLSKTIAGRITLSVLAIHLLILPTLYFGMVYLIKQSNEELFLNSVRGHARYLADSLERIGDSATDKEITEILDSVVLSGSGFFAELVGNNRRIMSSLVTEADAALYLEDLKFQEYDDGIYFFSVPVMYAEGPVSLHVGFDEAPYLEQNATAYKIGFIVIAGYLAILLMFLPIIGRRVAHPVKALQEVSRQIASGALSEHLTVETDLVELQDLSRDLDLMKDRLTGVSKQLQQEILDREKMELARISLEQQLRHSQRLETVGTMAGGIAHEINNILVPIILYTEIAIEDLPGNNPVRDDLVRVLRAATRAKSIVGQVLTFSRKMAADTQSAVNMAEAVRDSVELLRASVPAFANLEIKIDPHCPQVLGDAALMNQLILNLCTNAFQSLRDEHGSVSITLDLAEVDDDLAKSNQMLDQGQCVRLTVSDTGEGMDQETLARIFEPFFTTRNVGDGTGLGLSVVHGIVTDMNGVIHVESEVNSGSVFRVLLPAIHSVAHTERQAMN
jgi:signal transduction histidine kinase